MASASPSLPRSGQDLAVPPPQLRCSGSGRCFGAMWWAPSSPLSLAREAAEAMAASPASPLSLLLYWGENTKGLGMGGGRRSSGGRLKTLLEGDFWKGWIAC